MRIAITLLTTLLLVLGYGNANGQRKFELNDLDKLYTLTDPQISPDGKSVLLVASLPDTTINKRKSFVYKVDAATGATHQLTYERTLVSSPRWSPLGNEIAFIAADATGKGQIFVLSTNGGDARKITNSPTGVQQFSWSPDATTFAFVQEDEIPTKKEVEKGYDAFEIKNNSMFLNVKPNPSHIWLIPVGGGESKRLTFGTWTIHNTNAVTASTPLSWSPDGKKITFQSNETPYTGELISYIKVVDVATGLINRITNSQVANDDRNLERKPLFSPDGKLIAYQFPQQNFTHGSDIYITSSNGGAVKNVTSTIDRSFFKAEWSADSKAIFVAANDFNTVSLWIQPLDGIAKKLNLENLCIAGGYWYQYTIGKKNEIAFIASSPQSPPELYFMSNPESTPKQLSNFNAAVRNISLGKLETFTWKSDKFTPNGILTFPPDFDPASKYPLVVEPHGGPRATSKELFNTSAQLMAAHGYIVFQPNYRGSDNMGFEFTDAITEDMGEGPGRDVMTGLTELKKRNYIDSTKIAITGWSYGGFMTTWLIGNYQGWRCAIAGAAITDWFDQYTQSDIGSWNRFTSGKGKSPFTDKKVKENWIRNSPITYAENVKTPTLILSNTGDDRVPISQSYKYFRILQDIGTESKFIVFPIAGHIPTDPIRTKEMNRYILDWLDKYLK